MCGACAAGYAPEDALILRVSWVYGLRGANFLLTMRPLLAARETRELRLEEQQRARALTRLLDYVGIGYRLTAYEDLRV